MKVALGQMAVSKDSQENLSACLGLIDQALRSGAQLLVLPEGVLARNVADPEVVLKSAQALDGEFVSRLSAATRDTDLTVVFCIHTPAGEGKVWNTLVVLRDGQVLAHYNKLHLYDAFSVQESCYVQPGTEIPALIDVAGFKVGLMTCYDLRFPELARRLCVDGAQVLLAPSAWLKGPLKEHHWRVLTTARALENTAYMVAVGECGERNIGQSLVVDPLGVIVAQAAETPTLLLVDLDRERLAYARRILPVLDNRRFAPPELG
ncbi:hydrolase [Alcaligenes faecalis]|uniref:deaminated glutathione amidase n=1 Tax=Alcaligenes faecalis TaxID=511 RepID=UPI000A2E1DC5|nr:deaminated glutathione amidase [Alcaligenes faecalis]KAA1288819.1 deaminated glutathione amidase [Alcaligenes faecalis]OSZ36527.1 hydrolase [Alcaligenes faecalis]OSZ46604.1 hydrolase [Alcaligenes faecalis]